MLSGACLVSLRSTAIVPAALLESATGACSSQKSGASILLPLPICLNDGNFLRSYGVRCFLAAIFAVHVTTARMEKPVSTDTGWCHWRTTIARRHNFDSNLRVPAIQSVLSHRDDLMTKPPALPGTRLLIAPGARAEQRSPLKACDRTCKSVGF